MSEALRGRFMGDARCRYPWKRTLEEDLEEDFMAKERVYSVAPSRERKGNGRTRSRRMVYSKGSKGQRVVGLEEGRSLQGAGGGGGGVGALSETSSLATVQWLRLLFLPGPCPARERARERESKRESERDSKRERASERESARARSLLGTYFHIGESQGATRRQEEEEEEEEEEEGLC